MSLESYRNRPIVWVVQDNGNDYSAAEDFGDVRFITTSDWTPLLFSSANSDFLRDIKKWKIDYVPGHDFILPAGNPVAYMMVAFNLDQDGKHNILKWDGRRGAYMPYILTNKNG